MEHPSQDFNANKEQFDSAAVGPAFDIGCAPVQRPELIAEGPEFPPVTSEEIGLLRAFLSEDINRLLREP